MNNSRDLSAIHRQHEISITSSAGGNKKRQLSSITGGLSNNIRATNRLYNFNKVDLKNSRLTQNKKFIRETFLGGTNKRYNRSTKTMNEIQQVEIIQMFTEIIIDMAKQLVYPILYKTLVYFYSPAIEVGELEKIKEWIIIELFQVLISGHVSTDLQRLMRFTT